MKSSSMNTIMQILTKMENAAKTQTCATLAAAVITAAGRPVSINEAMEIQRNICFATYGGELAGHGSYQQWAKTQPEVLAKVFA